LAISATLGPWAWFLSLARSFCEPSSGSLYNGFHSHWDLDLDSLDVMRSHRSYTIGLPKDPQFLILFQQPPDERKYFVARHGVCCTLHTQNLTFNLGTIQVQESTDLGISFAGHYEMTLFCAYGLKEHTHFLFQNAVDLPECNSVWD